MMQIKNLIQAEEYDDAIGQLRELAHKGDNEAQKLLTETIKKRAMDIKELGSMEFSKKNYHQAIENYQKAIELAQETSDQAIVDEYKNNYIKIIEEYAQETNNQGDKMVSENNYQKAIELYQDSINLMTIAKNQERIENFTLELNTAKSGLGEQLLIEAESLCDLQKWQEAEEKYQKALQLIPPLVNSSLNFKINHSFKDMYAEWAQLINNHGDIAFKKEQYDHAIRLYAESVTLAKKSEKATLIVNFQKELNAAISGKAQEINNYGDSLYEKGAYKQAAELYMESIKIAQEAGNQKLVMNFSKEYDKSVAKLAQDVNNQGDEKYKNKDWEGAARLYKESIEIAIQSGNQRLVENFTQEFEKALEKWALLYLEKGAEVLNNKAIEQNDPLNISYFILANEKITESKNPRLIQSINNEIKNIFNKKATDLYEQAETHMKNKLYEHAAELYLIVVKVLEKGNDFPLLKKSKTKHEKALRLTQK